jgi:hypothetical protein
MATDGGSVPSEGGQAGNPMITAISNAVGSIAQTIGIGLSGNATKKQMQIQANSQAVTSAYNSHEARMNRAFLSENEPKDYTVAIALGVIGLVVVLLIWKK